MLLWFIILAPVLVAEIFRSPMVDYRMVVLGSVLPLIEVAVGRPWALHTLAGPVVVLTLVMLGTMNRRLVRRRLLGVPVGMFFHLVLDGAWNSRVLFWWPAFGFDLGDEPLPEASGLMFRLVLELVAVGVGLWAYRRYGLSEPSNRRLLARTGNLNRAFVN